jgi:hypothetical protein
MFQMSKSERSNLNRAVTGVVLLICGACTTGCMSVIASGGGTGGEASTGTKIAAGAVDVVTLPVQATLLGGWWALESANKQNSEGMGGEAKNSWRNLNL